MTCAFFCSSGLREFLCEAGDSKKMDSSILRDELKVQ
jgi:hypothetical protein